MRVPKAPLRTVAHRFDLGAPKRRVARKSNVSGLGQKQFAFCKRPHKKGRSEICFWCNLWKQTIVFFGRLVAVAAAFAVVAAETGSRAGADAAVVQ